MIYQNVPKAEYSLKKNMPIKFEWLNTSAVFSSFTIVQFELDDKPIGVTFQLLHEKACLLHMKKQRQRLLCGDRTAGDRTADQRLCFRY